MAQNLSTREKIIKAAKKLFSEQGYHNTTMAAVAEEAGLGKGTLYWHFESKKELFTEIFEVEGKIIKKQISQLRGKNLPVVVILKEFINNRLERMLGHKKITRMFLDSENYININFAQTILKLRDIILDELEVIIKEGIKSGYFRDINSRQAAIAILGMINNIAINIVTDDIYDISEYRDFLFDFIGEGLLENKEGLGKGEI